MRVIVTSPVVPRNASHVPWGSLGAALIASLAKATVSPLQLVRSRVHLVPPQKSAMLPRRAAQYVREANSSTYLRAHVQVVFWANPDQPMRMPHKSVRNAQPTPIVTVI